MSTESHPLPQTGGSFIRQPDGQLELQAEPEAGTAPETIEAVVPETPKAKTVKPAVKEA